MAKRTVKSRGKRRTVLLVGGGGGGGGATPTTFPALTDTPGSYAGAAGQVATVNGTQTGIEFTDVPTVERVADAAARATYEGTLGAADESQLIYQEDTNVYYYWNGTASQEFGGGSLQAAYDLGSDIVIDDADPQGGITITNNDVTNNVRPLSITNNGASESLSIASAGGSTGLFIDMQSYNATNSRALDIRINDDLANAANSHGSLIYSSTAHTGGGSLFRVENDNAAATNQNVYFKQDGTNTNVFVDTNGDSRSIHIDSESTTADVLRVDTVSTTGRDLVIVSGAKTGDTQFDGSALVYNNNAGATGNLLTAAQDNTAASSRVAFLYNDGTGNTLGIDTNNSGFSIDIDQDANDAADVIGMRINIANAGTGGQNALQLQDGSEAAGRVLVSDANGVATWGDGGILAVNTVALLPSATTVNGGAVYAVSNDTAANNGLYVADGDTAAAGIGWSKA